MNVYTLILSSFFVCAPNRSNSALETGVPQPDTATPANVPSWKTSGHGYRHWCLILGVSFVSGWPYGPVSHRARMLSASSGIISRVTTEPNDPYSGYVTDTVMVLYNPSTRNCHDQTRSPPTHRRLRISCYNGDITQPVRKTSRTCFTFS